MIDNIFKEKKYSFSIGELNNKTILVTGANRGLGQAIAMDLAKAGAKVVLLGRDLAGLEKIYDEIVAKNYPEPYLCPVDLEGATYEDYVSISQNIKKNSNNLDGIIHNAAILGWLSPIEHYEVKLWYRVMQVNLNAVFILTQQLLPFIKESNNGRILFISSGTGRVGCAYFGAYGVSKFALEGFMETLANELEYSNIKINSITPGVLQTQMRKSIYPDEDYTKNDKPGDISSVFVYLMSEKSKHLHGQKLSL